MSEWICPTCQEELGELNAYCEYCYQDRQEKIYNPDKFFIREIRIAQIIKGSLMTPQEELFAKLFNHEKVLVKDMDTLTLRAHREELAKIAFEARARLTAADDEENERKKLSSPKGPKGFERSVNTDETTSGAINAIKERQKRMSKTDKIKQSLLNIPGMDASFVEGVMSAGNILSRVKDSKSKESIINPPVRSPLSQDNGFVIQSKKEEVKPIFNPFEKK